ncbi:MAG: cytochrome c oxidase subunit 3 [Sneathiella sp.]|nr:cytochrome c oxidase subunit 3 [Sneathiella sp.]
MSLFKTVTSKPWTREQALLDDQFQGSAFQASPATLGLRIFLGVVTVLFLLLYVAYSGRIVFPDWRGLPEPSLLWVNTIVLILCSLVYMRAQSAAATGRMGPFKNNLLLAGLLSLTFVLGQLLAWRELVDLGFYASVNPINGFFYLLTGLHGVHLLGGLIVWLHTALKAFRGENPAALAQTTRLLAHYWHFLLLIWIVIFVSVPQFLTLFPEERWKTWCSLI